MEKLSVDIQRLCKPLNFEKPISVLAAALSFGGGLRRGGLSEEAMSLLVPIMSFDYMGAAEFEFGALPKALQAMAKHKLVLFKLKVKTSDKKRNLLTRGVSGVCEDEVLVLCHRDWKAEVSERIGSFGVEPGRQITREIVGLEEMIRVKIEGKEEWKYRGWIEINNGYAFFLDHEMGEKFANLFEYEVE